MKDLIRFVRERSPFYRDLYKDLPSEISSVEQLPVPRQEDFWEANSLDNNRLLTGPMLDGIILKSGGTTGKPKFSVFARAEWNAFTRSFAESLAHNGLRAGDRVANLFYVGELYGSFLFTHKVFEECPIGFLQLPIAGSTSPQLICKMLSDFEATVIAGVPTTLLGVIDYLEAHPEMAKKSKIRMLLFAGEAMYEDQRERVARILPGIEIRSIGYASTDAGFLGYSDSSCRENEFRVKDGFSVYEILDEETDQPIREAGLPGRAVVTDLHRRLMPVIRYPVGDRAVWLDPEGTKDRKFRLLGRSEESARIGPVTLSFDDLRTVLQPFKQRLGEFQFQLILVHHDQHDGLVIRIGTRSAVTNPSSFTTEIEYAICMSRAMYRECLEEGKILPLQIECVDPQLLEVNPRSGKLRRIIDRRLQS